MLQNFFEVKGAGAEKLVLHVDKSIAQRLTIRPSPPKSLPLRSSFATMRDEVPKEGVTGNIYAMFEEVTATLV